MNEMTFEVDGMTCGGCAISVQRAIERLASVQEVVVTRDPGRVVVRAADVAADRIENVIRQAGYAARRA